MGRGVHSPSDYKGSGGASYVPPAESGAEPRSKMDFMHILGQKEDITIYQYFCGTRENSPPLSTGLTLLSYGMYIFQSKCILIVHVWQCLPSSVNRSLVHTYRTYFATLCIATWLV